MIRRNWLLWPLAYSAALLPVVAAVACATPPARAPIRTESSTAATSPKVAAALVSPLEAARVDLEASRYEQAEARYRALLTQPSSAEAATLGLAEVQLVRGRYADVPTTVRALLDSQPSARRQQAAWLAAVALRKSGKFEEAKALLEVGLSEPTAWAARVLYAELLIEEGRRFEARETLAPLFDAYNEGTVRKDDAESLALIGRAAELLRSPRDANDAYNEAEQASTISATRLLLWRAQMFLDKYDPGHAEEVVQEILLRAPQHPEALVISAQVELAKTMDFASATDRAEQALKVNPNLSEAFFVLAGARLRDLELDKAQAFLDQGLSINPRDLELLSLSATIRFLDDDATGFHELEQRVMAYNPSFSRFYTIVAEYADWEHRYDEIVRFMRDAVKVDNDDAVAYANLGLNLIRVGDDEGGVRALQTSFGKDPFNVRVYNTLGLFEKSIPEQYVSDAGPEFRFRYDKISAPLLRRYVPALMNQAFSAMVGYYGFTPTTPVGVELYPEREHFAIRTSGLPNVGIQGVCFGKTLAVISSKTERINVGMTLWHELAHVFHIQLSKSHVPRWFTEGLAEYETIVARPEWRREQDPELYRALKDNRLPQVAQMNRAFSYAEDMSDIAVAYYASSQIVAMLAENYGRAKLRRMLVLWGQGASTEAVLEQALGRTPAQIDEEFRSHVKKTLARYEKVFMPATRGGDPVRLSQRLSETPTAIPLQLRLALALVRSGEAEQARTIVDRVLAQDAKNPDARFLLAELKITTDAQAAKALVDGLLEDGYGGYDVEMRLAQILDSLKEQSGVEQALMRAHAADPSQAEAIQGLLNVAQQRGDKLAELAWTRKLALLQEHSAPNYQRLLELLIERREFEEAIRVGQSAILVDLEGARTHQLYAEALAGKGKQQEAEFEFESALSGMGDLAEQIAVRQGYAAFLERRGNVDKAKALREAASKLEAQKAAPVAAP